MMYTIPESYTLSHGSHTAESGQTCARELVHLIVTGAHADRTPECLTTALAALPPLNDWSGWRDDAHRTEFFRPWLPRLLQQKRDAARDQWIAFALADYAVRVIAEVDCEPITDERTARTAAEWATAARAAARTATAATAAERAVWAAWAARTAARTAARAAFNRHAVEILRIICEVE
jgi:hypothetical protein